WGRQQEEEGGAEPRLSAACAVWRPGGGHVELDCPGASACTKRARSARLHTVARQRLIQRSLTVEMAPAHGARKHVSIQDLYPGGKSGFGEDDLLCRDDGGRYCEMET
ncbi:MAG: hypothetical protein KGO50_18250, partial [Myxococcales bacterium]|nr:hypothetical protein [Myxococcales bacterium]